MNFGINKPAAQTCRPQPKSAPALEKSSPKTKCNSSQIQQQRKPWNFSVRVDQESLYSRSLYGKPKLPLYPTHVENNSPTAIRSWSKCRLIKQTDFITTSLSAVGRITKSVASCNFVHGRRKSPADRTGRFTVTHRDRYSLSVSACKDKSTQASFTTGKGDEIRPNTSELQILVSRVCMWYLKVRTNLSDLNDGGLSNSLDIYKLVLGHLDQLQTLLGKSLPDDLYTRSPLLNDPPGNLAPYAIGDKSDNQTLTECSAAITTALPESNRDYKTEASDVDVLSDRHTSITAVPRPYASTSDVDGNIESNQIISCPHFQRSGLSHLATSPNRHQGEHEQRKRFAYTEPDSEIHMPNIQIDSNCNNRCTSADEPFCPFRSNSTSASYESVKFYQRDYSSPTPNDPGMMQLSPTQSCNECKATKTDQTVIHCTKALQSVSTWMDSHLEQTLAMHTEDCLMSGHAICVVHVESFSLESTRTLRIQPTVTDEDMQLVEAVPVRTRQRQDLSHEADVSFSLPDPPPEMTDEYLFHDYQIHQPPPPPPLTDWEHSLFTAHTQAGFDAINQVEQKRTAPYLLWGCKRKTTHFEKPSGDSSFETFSWS